MRGQIVCLAHDVLGPVRAAWRVGAERPHAYAAARAKVLAGRHDDGGSDSGTCRPVRLCTRIDLPDKVPPWCTGADYRRRRQAISWRPCLGATRRASGAAASRTDCLELSSGPPAMGALGSAVHHPTRGAAHDAFAPARPAGSRTRCPGFRALVRSHRQALNICRRSAGEPGVFNAETLVDSARRSVSADTDHRAHPTAAPWRYRRGERDIRGRPRLQHTAAVVLAQRIEFDDPLTGSHREAVAHAGQPRC